MLELKIESMSQRQRKKALQTATIKAMEVASFKTRKSLQREGARVLSRGKRLGRLVAVDKTRNNPRGRYRVLIYYLATFMRKHYSGEAFRSITTESKLKSGWRSNSRFPHRINGRLFIPEKKST